MEISTLSPKYKFPHTFNEYIANIPSISKVKLCCKLNHLEHQTFTWRYLEAAVGTLFLPKIQKFQEKNPRDSFYLFKLSTAVLNCVSLQST